MIGPQRIRGQVRTLSTKHNIKFGLYKRSDAKEMVQLLSEVFAERDPPAVAVGLIPSEFETFVRLFCPQAADQELTIVARCAETGEMCGALLTEDSASGLPDGIDRLSAKFNPIFDILGQLDEEYRGSEVAAPGESIHLFLLGVSQHFSGKGVARQLVTEGLSNGAGKGYCKAVTEATNRTSQHIFRKQGFIERVRRSYSEYQFDGRASFASITEQGGPILMDRQLTVVRDG
jgi:ribosomal protein S18 acetylase RimI-like enzyme